MGLPCIPYILLELFMSLNACSDFKWAYIVFLSYFWNYSCLLMHAWILYGLSMFSFNTFGFIHVPLMHAHILNGLSLYSFHTFGNYSCPLMHAWILNWLTLFSFHTFGIIHVP